MENPIFIGLSRQLALQKNMDVIANNIANMNTPGYRAQNMVFTEYLADPKGARDPLSMVLDYGHFQQTEEGPVSVTENPLDVALGGPGFFGVQTPEGIKYTRAGNFELNVMMPVMAHNLLQSMEILANVSVVLTERCVRGIEADEERCRRNAESTAALATALAPRIGYDEAADVAKTSLEEDKTLRQVVRERGLLSEEELDEVLDFRSMTEPGIP